MKTFRSILLPVLAVFLLPLQSFGKEKPTNFVFFLVDDLGWADVSCFGSTFHETPNIDSLAASGMKFINGYAAASICSPTRASIMTGRHPARVDITDWIPGNNVAKSGKFKFQHLDDRDNLALEETTIAEALKAHDYATFFAGKWHLGKKGFWPDDQGFDINIGGHDRGSPPGGYYAPWKNPALEAKKKGEYLTERLTQESVDFIKGRKKEQPFLLYLSYYNVHTPIQPYKKRIDHFLDKAKETFEGETPRIGERDAVSRGRQDNPEFASMVAAVDDSVGEILSALDELGLADNTVVIFFSDNGGLCTLPATRGVGPTCNLPLRSGKGWLYEGGIREATIVRAPGVTKAGSVCEEPVMSTDFFPTMLDLAGFPLMPGTHNDGISLLPLLKGKALPEKDQARDLVWHYPHYHGSGWTPGAAIRSDNWKLIEFWEHDEVELYDLSGDPGEQKDLSNEKPEVVKDLQERIAAWQKRVGAKMPEKNPDFR